MNKATNRIALPLRLLSLGLVIPTVLSMINYFGFFTNYTCCAFAEEGFVKQYIESSIYRYRVLGVQLLLKTYQLTKDWPVSDFAPYALKTMDPAGDAHFYFAYFLQNTIFLCLSCAMLVLILARHARTNDFLHVDMPVLLLAALMALAQFVITPYDMLSCFFLTIGIWLSLQSRQSGVVTAALALVMILATLTRETATLILCFYAAIHSENLIKKPVKSLTSQQKNLLLMLVLFAITYWSLRWQLGFYHATHRSVRWMQNLQDPLSLAGLALFPAAVSLFFTDSTARKPLLVFLITATPYWLAMPIVAYPWEIRLWVPILIGLVIIKLTAPSREVAH